MKMETAIRSGVDLKSLGKRVIQATENQSRTYANGVLKMMRDNFAKHTHNSEYGSRTPIGHPNSDNRSLGFIGLSARDTGNGKWEVGPTHPNATSKKYPYPPQSKKLNYQEIMGIIEHGVSKEKPWTFKLSADRASATVDGFMTVKSLPARPFMADTLKQLEGSVGDKLFRDVFSKEVEKALRGV